MLNLEGKEQFPHNFVNKNTIDYKKLISANKYFIIVNKKKNYLKMIENQKDIWSIKDNYLDSLKKDLDILYDTIIMFAQTIGHE